jgi:UPF0755 protein
MVAILGAAWVYNGPGPAAKAGDKTTVVLRKGASLPEIATSLEHGGVIRPRRSSSPPPRPWARPAA